ncbi:transposase [Hydrogenophaga sp.]|uniref:transposase n=1 Tax=Hydrogenophaga sp. TaxID=1904254 RepID=UPI003AF45215
MAPLHDRKRGRAFGGTVEAMPGDYVVVATGKSQPSLKCQLCGEIFPMQSNLAIAEELLRISTYLEPVLPRCSDETCAASSGTSTKPPTRFGTNRHGTPRYKCANCGKTFTFGGKSTKRQRETHVNRDVFRRLVNTVPIRRIIKLLGISTSVLYDRIDFIYEQCRLFAGERERTLIDRTDLGRRRISVDRQKLMVNWSSKKQRRNTTILSMASADQDTGYIYGTHLNFDEEMDDAAVSKDLVRFGDHHLAQPFRRYARIWLERDYERAAKRADGRRKAKKEAAELVEPSLEDRLVNEVSSRYEDVVERDVIDDGDEPSLNSRTPAKGMLLHEQSVMHAHIQFVSRLLQRATKIRFYLDQEPGLRAAFMAAQVDRVLNRTADAFYVQVTKDGTVDQKRGLVGKSIKAFRRMCEAHPDFTEEEVELLLIRAEMERVREIGKWNDRWLRHPLSDMREPVKMICWLTDIEKQSEDRNEREAQLQQAARLYRRASLNEIDRFFMQLRRALTMAERGVVSASADRRLWFGKNAYNPGVLAKLVEIFRTYFNYCEVGEDKRTPAMRMGLARGPVAEEDILYFVPGEPPRQRASSVRRAPEESPSQHEAGGAINEVPAGA